MSYVTFGCDSQLASLVGRERKYDTDGYRIVPLSNGQQGDGFGSAVWVATVRPADMTAWKFSAIRNTWTKQAS